MIQLNKHFFKGLLLGGLLLSSHTLQGQTEVSIDASFSTDFEDNADNQKWSFANDNTNKWCIGSASSKEGNGGHSIYISDDEGTTNGYNNGKSQFSYAYRTFTFKDVGTYSVTFDWKCFGESENDYFCVALVPDSVTPQHGESALGSWSMSSPSGAFPEGYFGKKYLCLNAAWQQDSFTIQVKEQETTYKLVLGWRNDGSRGSYPPGAVDNLSIVCDKSTYEDLITEYAKEKPSLPVVMRAAKAKDSLNMKTTMEEWNRIWENFRAFADAQSEAEPATLSHTQGYSTGFEDENEYKNWMVCDGHEPVFNYSNWRVGTAAKGGTDTALYVSNDEGKNYVSTDNKRQNSYIYRTVTFADSGVYAITFDWRCQGYKWGGNSYYLYMSALLVPDSITPEGGNDTLGNIRLKTYGSYELPKLSDYGYFGDLLSKSNEWEKHTFWANVKANTTYKFVLGWRTDQQMGGDEVGVPGALDNLNIFYDWRLIYKDSIDALVQRYPLLSIVMGAAKSRDSIDGETTDKNKIQRIWENFKTFAQSQSAKSAIISSSQSYFTGFGDENEYKNWVVCDDRENNWRVGTAAKEGMDTALYISNDEGKTYTYTDHMEQNSYIYRTITFEDAGKYTITFDWKCMTYSEWYMSVVLVPDSVTPQGGISNLGTWSMLYVISPFPESYFGKSRLNTENINVWNRDTFYAEVEAKSTYKLVLCWKDGTSAKNYPGALDNLSITCDKSTYEDLITEYAKRKPLLPVVMQAAKAKDSLDMKTTMEERDEIVKNFRAFVTAYTAEAESAILSHAQGYSTGFGKEDEYKNWIVCDAGENNWRVGTAAKSSDTALYISNDEGKSYTYDNSKTQYSYIYRTLTFTEAGEYAVAFDWNCAGESNDYMSVGLIPEGTIPQGGESFTFPTATSKTELFGKNSTPWQRDTLYIKAEANTAYNLVLGWTNNADNAGSNPPGAVDNLSIVCDISTYEDLITRYAKTKSSLFVKYQAQKAKDSLDIKTTMEERDEIVKNFRAFVTAYTAEAEPATLSHTQGYSTGFGKEDEYKNWIVCDDSENNWRAGTAAKSSDTALYISNKEGTAYTYDNSKTQYSYIYRTLTFTESGEYAVAFDWNCAGESNDYMSVGLIPEGTIPQGGESFTFPTATSKTKLFGKNSTSWQRDTLYIKAEANTAYNLVLGWTNNADNAGSNPPGAVDNISVEWDEVSAREMLSATIRKAEALLPTLHDTIEKNCLQKALDKAYPYTLDKTKLKSEMDSVRLSLESLMQSLVGSEETPYAFFYDIVTIDNPQGNYLHFQWYHNGEKVGEDMDCYQEKGGLTGEYYVIITCKDGTTFTSNTATFALSAALEGTQKRMLNGSPVIFKDGHIYTIEGTRLK